MRLRRFVLIAAVCWMVPSCLVAPGCTIALQDKGEVMIEFTQGVRIGHSTSTTEAESVAVYDPQPLMDWLIEITGESPQSVDMVTPEEGA